MPMLFTVLVILSCLPAIKWFGILRLQLYKCLLSDAVTEVTPYLIPISVLVTLPLLVQNIQHLQLKREKVYIGLTFPENSAHGWFAPGKKLYNRKLWHRNSAHLMAAKKQRDKREARDKQLKQELPGDTTWPISSDEELILAFIYMQYCNQIQYGNEWVRMLASKVYDYHLSCVWVCRSLSSFWNLLLFLSEMPAPLLMS